MKTNGAVVRETEKRLAQLQEDKTAVTAELRTARKKLDRINKLIASERRFAQAHQ